MTCDGGRGGLFLRCAAAQKLSRRMVRSLGMAAGFFLAQARISALIALNCPIFTAFIAVYCLIIAKYGQESAKKGIFISMRVDKSRLRGRANHAFKRRRRKGDSGAKLDGIRERWTAQHGDGGRSAVVPTRYGAMGRGRTQY